MRIFIHLKIPTNQLSKTESIVCKIIHHLIDIETKEY